MFKVISFVVLLHCLLPLPGHATVDFTANGIVYAPYTIIVYNSQGQPALMSFSVQDIPSGQIQTFYCHRPYLSACTFVDSTTIGKKIHITGVMEDSTWIPGWQPYAQNTSYVYMVP